jgi:hypothetical protein
VLEEIDPLIDDIARELRAPVAADPAARVRIMAAVFEAPPPARRASTWEWFTRPRNVRVSPLGGLAALGAAAVVAVAIAVGGNDASGVEKKEPAARMPVAAAPSSAPQSVQFVLVAPAASRVAIVGDFNDWDATATQLRQEARAGLWSVVVPLHPGRHQYAFVVDGNRWLADPSAPRAADDDFGSPSSVITVGEKRT